MRANTLNLDWWVITLEIFSWGAQRFQTWSNVASHSTIHLLNVNKGTWISNASKNRGFFILVTSLFLSLQSWWMCQVSPHLWQVQSSLEVFFLSDFWFDSSILPFPLPIAFLFFWIVLARLATSPWVLSPWIGIPYPRPWELAHPMWCKTSF